MAGWLLFIVGVVGVVSGYSVQLSLVAIWCCCHCGGGDGGWFC